MDVKTVIMAGGKGTRISGIASGIPKPMIDICGKPLLERQIDWLKAQGIRELTIIVGHLGNKIREYFFDGRSFGVSINYVIEEVPLGTAGGLYHLKFEDNRPILLINGDIMIDINLKKLLEYHYKKHADITLLTHPNNHPFDSALIETNHDGKVINWLNKEDYRGDYKNRVNAGIHVIETHTLSFMENMKQPEKVDLDRELLKPNIGEYNIYAYDTPEYVKDMGTPERYQIICDDYRKGIVNKKNLRHKQRAIFLDRDGTVNKYKGYITEPTQLELIDGAAEAIRIINKAGYLAILITNQPIIARGDRTIEDLEHIHNRLERLLGESGAYLDDIFYCPHHPDKGFSGERVEYKIACACRKPKPGLLYQAAAKYNIDFANSFMIGDSVSDIMAGEAAGCKTGYIINEKIEKQSKPVKADIVGKSLNEIVGEMFNDYY